jgi:hypothetical protein
MHKFIITLFFILFMTVNSWCQTETKYDSYFGIGLTIPSSPQSFVDKWKKGYNADMGIGFSIIKEVSLIFSLEYSLFPLDKDKMLSEIRNSNNSNIRNPTSASAIEGGTTSEWNLSSNIVFFMFPQPASFSPYVCASIGYCLFTVSDITVTENIWGRPAWDNIVTKNEFAISTSCGVGIAISAGESTSLCIEGSYFTAYTKGGSTNIIPIKLGVRVRY